MDLQWHDFRCIAYKVCRVSWHLCFRPISLFFEIRDMKSWDVQKIRKQCRGKMESYKKYVGPLNSQNMHIIIYPQKDVFVASLKSLSIVNISLR